LIKINSGKRYSRERTSSKDTEPKTDNPKSFVPTNNFPCPFPPLSDKLKPKLKRKETESRPKYPGTERNSISNNLRTKMVVLKKNLSGPDLKMRN
jgi:hypothetical protein